VAVETLSALGHEAFSFFKDIGRCMACVTAESQYFQFLVHRLSMAIQRDNAAYVVATVPVEAYWDDLFYV
jgi:hypothetical protein